MSGSDTQRQESTSQSQTSPWEAAMPMLQGLISKYTGLNTDVTAGQTTGANNLVAGASGVPSFGNQASDAVSKIFGTDTGNQIGMLNTGYDTLNKNLGATASGAELNPYDTPGFSDALNTSMNDITNRVKGVYAGSGRDPSGAGSFAGSLGRGLTQGVAPTIAAQYNANKGNQMTAANNLFAGANTTAGGITGQQGAQNASWAQALGLLPSMSGAYTLPGQTQLSAANTQYGLPFANLQAMLTPAAGLGAMGQQSTGSGTQTTTIPQNTTSNILGGITGGLGLLSMFGA